MEKHYSPRAEVRLFAGPDADAVDAIRRLAESSPGVGVLAYTEDLGAYRGAAAEILDLGSRVSLEEVAQALYASLRELDARGVDCIAARLAPSGGLGDAINDRLTRAACGRVTRVG
jgi:L-threonylcarbamoyladenylate synthase